MPEIVYEHGGIRIYLGDGLEILPALSRASVDSCSPIRRTSSNYQGRWDGRKTIVGDADPSWLVPAYREIYRVLKARLVRGDVLRLAARRRLRGHLQGGRLPAGEPPGVREERLGARPVHPRPARDGLPAREGPAAGAAAAGISDVIEWEREPDAFHPNQKPVAALRPLIAAYAPEAGACSTHSWGAEHGPPGREGLRHEGHRHRLRAPVVPVRRRPSSPGGTLHLESPRFDKETQADSSRREQMSDISKIEWTERDAGTPGRVQRSRPGCTGCYAVREVTADGRQPEPKGRGGQPGPRPPAEERHPQLDRGGAAAPRPAGHPVRLAAAEEGLRQFPERHVPRDVPLEFIRRSLR